MESRFGHALRALAGLLAAGAVAWAAAQTSPITLTPHNLSRTGLNNTLNSVRAADSVNGPTEVCAFCHTPHGASSNVNGPLWNRSLSNATYTRYTSASLDAHQIIGGLTEQPAGSSLLCLSCHDGMVAIGNVNVLNGQSQSITMQNTNNNKMPIVDSLGVPNVLTGFTRNLGTDLSNDHPISITYDDVLAQQDGEMTRLTTGSPGQRDKMTGDLIGIRTSGYKPKLPLEPTGPNGLGQVQCGTCHDPHISADKFLRLNRFQTATPTGGNFNEATDQICLACHPKLGNAWAESAHAKPIVADEQYKSAAATKRGFPTTTKVWQAACLNCHDTHTVQGSRRLLREGVESPMTGTGAGDVRQGSAITPADAVSAIENTCYQCHDDAGLARRAIDSGNGSVPNVRREFERMVRMPIATADQIRVKKEVHDILNADFIESPEALGRNNIDNRHVECTDCHNPHRVRRGSTFYETSSATGEGAKRTHNVGGPNGNIASGVLRGTWGVEPVFGPITNDWPQNPIEYIVKKGDPGTNTSTDRNKTYLTREYQLCFKCHSNYSNSDDPKGFPALGNTLGGTQGSPSFRNNLNRYTNVAAEFGSVKATDPPTSGTDQGEYSNAGTACGGGDCAPNGSYPSGLTTNGSDQTYNHRSWHPVMWPTGRDRAERAMNATGVINLRPPFEANIGKQTMYCSDCHGHGASWIRGTGPDTTQTQGPHGSDDKFLLKGLWSNQVTLGNVDNVGNFCGNCHVPSNSSGYGGDHRPDDKMGGETCMWCHISVPHGWRNKAFLANLRCVGTEGGEAGTCNNIGGSDYSVVSRPPYYNFTRLRVATWARSGSWTSAACGGATMEDGCPRTD
jgi:hypothetical protein